MGWALECAKRKAEAAHVAEDHVAGLPKKVHMHRSSQEREHRRLHEVSGCTQG